MHLEKQARIILICTCKDRRINFHWSSFLKCFKPEKRKYVWVFVHVPQCLCSAFLRPFFLSLSQSLLSFVLYHRRNYESLIEETYFSLHTSCPFVGFRLIYMFSTKVVTLATYPSKKVLKSISPFSFGKSHWNGYKTFIKLGSFFSPSWKVDISRGCDKKFVIDYAYHHSCWHWCLLLILGQTWEIELIEWSACVTLDESTLAWFQVFRMSSTDQSFKFTPSQPLFLL